MKNMKKHAKLFLSAMAAAVMMAAPAAVKADDADPVQLDGENNYTDDNGIVYNFVISGSSATLGMIDLSGADAYDVVVPGAVTKGDVTASVSQIKNGIFCKKTEITSIDISATKVTTFQTRGYGHTAFEGCSGMASIKLPETLIQLPNYMFDGCSSLEMVEIPASVKTFGTNPAGVAHTRIFNGCTSLMDILVDEKSTSFKDIDGVLYDKAGTTLYAYPAGRDAETYVVPDGVTKIFHGAFQNAQHLKKVRFPSSLTEVGQYAFWGDSVGDANDNSLEEAWFYGNLASTKMGTSAFLSTMSKIQKANGISLDSVPEECRGSVKLEASVLPAAAEQGVVWSIDSTEYADLTSDGTLTPKAAGTVKVTATSTDEKWSDSDADVTASKQITIVPYASKVTVSGEKTEVVEGDEVTFTAQVQPEGIRDSQITWSVDNAELAGIDENGILTAKKAGTVTVTAANKDGDPAVNDGKVEGTFQLTIKAKLVEPTATPVPAEPTATPAPAEPTATPAPVAPTATPAPTQAPEVTVEPTKAPEAPVKAVKTSETQIKITWQKDPAAKKGYRIYVKGGKSKGWTKVADVAANKNSYVFKKLKGQALQSGTTYQFRIVSLTKNKKTEGKTEILKTNTAPGKAALKASSPKKGTVKLTWKKVKGAVGYEIQLKTSKKGSYKTVKVLGKKATSYTQKNLGKGKTIYIRVRTFNTANGAKIYSKWAATTVKLK